MFMQNGNIAQYDQIAAHYTFHYSIAISREYKIVSLLVKDLGTVTQHTEI